MHDPQFVPARKMAPISVTLVSRQLAIVPCKVFRPTPKHAQIVRPAAFAAAAPAGLPASSAVRISNSIRVPSNAATASRDGSEDGLLAMNRQASKRLPITLA